MKGAAGAPVWSPIAGQLFLRIYKSRTTWEQKTLLACRAGVQSIALVYSTPIAGTYRALRTELLDEDAPAITCTTAEGTFTRCPASDADLRQIFAAWRDPEVPPWGWWARLDQRPIAPGELRRIKEALEAALAGWHAPGSDPAGKPPLLAQWMQFVAGLPIDPTRLFDL